MTVTKGLVLGGVLAFLLLMPAVVRAQEEKPTNPPPADTSKPERPPRPGVQRPGVKRDIAAIKPIAERRHAGRGLGPCGQGVTDGDAEPDDARHVGRPRPDAALLPAARPEWPERVGGT